MAFNKSLYELSESIKSSLKDLSWVKDSVVDTFKSITNYFFKNLFVKESTISIIGIENSGKSTLVGKILTNTNNIYKPTKHPITTTFDFCNIKGTIVDLGGHDKGRLNWEDFLFAAHGIIFMIDLFDEEKYEVCKYELNSVLHRNIDTPILIFMNKLDLTDYSDMNDSEMALRNSMPFRQSIEEYFQIPNRPNIRIVYMSVINDDILAEKSQIKIGFEWLAEEVNKIHSREK
ncbi:SAR1 [Hepatospora eriocheir]|uniref:SAR1 n=1 Tax=Hepatospora eriocheir TaxID=1081669 RepID=A0A1X0QJS3_9MICR|nr:SAR1 [Hepatospora eriocheir]